MKYSQAFFGACVAVAALVLVASLLWPEFSPVDFPSWRSDFRVFRCVLGGGCYDLSKFPFAYALNSGLAKLFWSERFGLLILNLSAVGTALVAIRCFSNRPGVSIAIFLCAIGGTSIPSFYLNSGGLEVQSGVVLGIALSSFSSIFLFENRSVLCRSLACVSWFLCFLFKDTNLFLLVVGVFGVVVSRPKVVLKSISDKRFDLVLLMCALVLSAAVAFFYNYSRYGSLFPVGYLAEADGTRQSFPWVFKNFIGLIFSLNGGLLVFWGGAFVCIVAAKKVFSISYGLDAVLCSVLVLLGSAVMLSFWWTPFGWEGWGGRLMIPSVVASLIVVVSGVVTKVPVLMFRRSSLWVFFLSCVFLISSGYSLLAASPFRQQVMFSSLAGKSCGLMFDFRSRIDSQEFKNSKIYKDCHVERYLHVPGVGDVVRPSGMLADGVRFYSGKGEGVQMFGDERLVENAQGGGGGSNSNRLKMVVPVGSEAKYLSLVVFPRGGAGRLLVFVDGVERKVVNLKYGVAVDLALERNSNGSSKSVVVDFAFECGVDRRQECNGFEVSDLIVV